MNERLPVPPRQKHPLEPQKVEYPLLALDVSNNKIGFAVSYGKLCFARGGYWRTTLAQDIEVVRSKMALEGTPQLVLGLPLRTDGKPSTQAQKIRSFGHALRQAGMAVFYQDERFTTKSARADLRGSGGGDVDAQSAVRILEMFLESVSREE